MLYYERKLKKKGYPCVIGVDEAGCGPLAGPVVAAAVILKNNRFKNRIDDSKKLTPLQREKAFHEITNKTTFSIAVINEKIIDHFNIFVATRIAMEKALNGLLKKIGKPNKEKIHIIVDGRVKPEVGESITNIIKGDAKSKSIACASILAKVTRDRIMFLYDKVYPQYGFKRHKGYPTKAHRIALEKFGPSIIHRNTFCGV